MRSNKLGTIPELVREVKGQNDGSSQVTREEGIHQLRGSLLLVANGGETDPELGDQHEAVENEADPGTDDTGLRAERQLIQGVSLSLPGAAEPNVSEADGAPGEDGRETGDSHHPCEGDSLLVRGSQEAKQTDDGGDKNRPERTTLAVDVGEEARSLALLGESSKGTRRTVDGGVTDGEHRNHDDDVHDGGQTLDSGVLNGNDEGRCVGIGRRATGDETLGVVGDEEANQSKGDHVKDGNTPEHLLDGTGERLAGIGSLGRGQTNQLGTGEGKGSIDEDTAKTLKAVVERTRVVPVASTDVTTFGATTAVQNDSEDTMRKLVKMNQHDKSAPCQSKSRVKM